MERQEIRVMVSEEGNAYFASADKNALLDLGDFLAEIFPDGEQEPVRWHKNKKENQLFVDRHLKPPKRDLEALLAIYRSRKS